MSLKGILGSALGPDSFSCRKCNQPFSSWALLKQHQVRSYFKSCPLCNAKFPNQKRLEKHLPKHNKEFNCPACPKIKKTKHALYLHLKTHNKKSHQCPICLKFMATQKVLQVHVLLHSGKRPYACRKCSKSFKDPAALRRHENTHKKVSFRCSECQRSFSRKATLKQHLRTHANVKLTCAFCPKQYGYRQSLQKHVKKAHHEKCFSCQKCKKLYISKKHFTHHSC